MGETGGEWMHVAVNFSDIVEYADKAKHDVPVVRKLWLLARQVLGT